MRSFLLVCSFLVVCLSIGCDTTTNATRDTVPTNTYAAKSAENGDSIENSDSMYYFVREDFEPGNTKGWLGLEPGVFQRELDGNIQWAYFGVDGLTYYKKKIEATLADLGGRLLQQLWWWWW